MFTLPRKLTINVRVGTAAQWWCKEITQLLRLAKIKIQNSFCLSQAKINNLYACLFLPCYFTLIDIKAPLGHVAHAPLGLLGGEGVEVVDKWSLVCDLKVADTAVTLSNTDKYAFISVYSRTQIKTIPLTVYYFMVDLSMQCLKGTNLPTKVNHIGVWIVEGQEDSVAGVHLMNRNGLIHTLLKNEA